MNRLVLIDGNAMMHRAYHALPPLTDPDGRPVHVVYGFLSMILRLFHDLKPTHIAVAFDRPGPTFRNHLFAQYQAQRPKMEDDFIGQIALVHDAVTAFGIPLYEQDGYEADDIIGTIATQVASRKSNVESERIEQTIIVTGDRDILQLVTDEKTLVFMPTKGLSEGKLYGEHEVRERMGVKPALIPDYKALAGDASDNYPGVPGIGPKTAIFLLETFGSVEALYASLPKVSNKTVQMKLASGKENALLGKTLATIRVDAPIVFDARAARLRTMDSPSARAILERFHFPSLLRRLAPDTRAPAAVVPSKTPRKNEGEQQALF